MRRLSTQALLTCLVMATSAYSQVALEPTPAYPSTPKKTEVDVTANQLVELRVSNPCWWDPRDPLDLDLHQYELADGSYLAIFWSGSGDRTVIVDAWRNGELFPVHDRFVVVVGSGDDGGDTPVPPPIPPGDDIGPAVAAALAKTGVPAPELAQIFSTAADNLATKRNIQRSISVIVGELKQRGISADGSHATAFRSWVAVMKSYWERTDAKRVQTVDEHVAAFRAIAKALSPQLRQKKTTTNHAAPSLPIQTARPVRLSPAASSLSAPRLVQRAPGKYYNAW